MSFTDICNPICQILQLFKSAILEDSIFILSLLEISLIPNQKLQSSGSNDYSSE